VQRVGIENDQMEASAMTFSMGASKKATYSLGVGGVRGEQTKGESKGSGPASARSNRYNYGGDGKNAG